METATATEMEMETDPIIYMSMNEPSSKDILKIATTYVKKFKDERDKDTASQAPPVDTIINFDSSKYTREQYDTAVAFITKYDTRLPDSGNDGKGMGHQLVPVIGSMDGGRHRPKPSKKRSTRRRRSSKRKSRKVNNRRK